MSPTRTPATACIGGSYDAGTGNYVFTGTGVPGDSIYIVTQPGNISLGSWGTVEADGSFSIAVGNPGLVAGHTVEAHSGSSSGPSCGGVTVLAAEPTAAAPIGNIAGGATVFTVTGAPGEVVVLVDQTTGEVLGSGTIQANGQAAIDLDTAAVAGQNILVLSSGHLDTTASTGANGSAPQVDQGVVLTEGSTLTGTGTPGALIQVVDDQGRVLGSTTVQPDGSWALGVSGAVAGSGLKLIQDGVVRALPQPALSLGARHVFTSTNVFRPLQGGSLDIGFKASADERITVKIFSLSGETVRRIAEIDAKTGVLYALHWDGRNDASETVAAGLYIVSVHGPSTRILKKVVVLK